MSTKLSNELHSVFKDIAPYDLYTIGGEYRNNEYPKFTKPYYHDDNHYCVYTLMVHRFHYRYKVANIDIKRDYVFTYSLN